MIHYFGTPITPSVMLDNGAYSFWTQGRPTNWSAYYRWCEPWLAFHTTWAVIPDVIDGNDAANDRLVEQWPFGDRGAPVWHPHEPLERLLQLAANWPRVCTGGSPAFSQIRSRAWHARIADAMDALCGDGPPPTWLHLLRGMALAGEHYPVASADSSSLARNHKGAASRRRPPRDPAKHAGEIAARQCPACWRSVPSQLPLFASAR